MKIVNFFQPLPIQFLLNLGDTNIEHVNSLNIIATEQKGASVKTPSVRMCCLLLCPPLRISYQLYAS